MTGSSIGLVLVFLFYFCNFFAGHLKLIEGGVAADVDVVEGFLLGEEDGLLLHHFENRQEQTDHRTTALLLLEKLGDGDGFGAGEVLEAVFEHEDHVGDGDVLGVDLIEWAVLGAFENGLESLDEIEQGNRKFGLVVVAEEAVDLGIGPDGLLDHCAFPAAWQRRF